jgi:serine phosphatase RsbU (regulator of sigma subunit)
VQIYLLKSNIDCIFVPDNFKNVPMKIDEDNLLNLLKTKFESELALEMIKFPVIQFPANLIVGKQNQELQFISIILNGSIRAIRYDEKGEEVLIYNIEPMQSCIISITSAIRNHASLIFGITNNEVTAIGFPKSKGMEWMAKYESWRNFVLELYEWRLNELIDNHQTLKKQKDNILQSIHYAKRIQNAVLPPEDYINSLLPEHFILFKPRDIVSGDYYWITQINEKTIVVAADCTGHGVPGAFMSMLGITLLNQYVNNHDLLPANQILEHLRNNIKESLRQSDYDSDTKDGMDMALLIFDNKNNELQFAGANNPLYIFRNNELIKFDADKMPVGVHIDESKKFRQHIFNYQKGDVFYTFSDGYMDQTGGNLNRKFMRKNLLSLLTDIHQKPMIEQKEILDNNLTEWRGKNDQVDDILVIGIKV